MRTRSLLTIALLLLPAAATADQVDYGVTSQGGWTDNVFGTGDEAQTESIKNGQRVLVDVNPVSDYSVRLSPWVKLSDPDGDFTWSVKYKPSYEYYLQETDINGFDHDADGEVSLRVGDRTTFTAGETIQQYRSLLRFNENAGSLVEPAVFRGQRDKLFATLTTLQMRHSLTPRDLITLDGSYNTRDYSTSNNNPSSSYLGSTFTHMLTERTTVGLQGAWTRQMLDRSVGNQLVTDYYNISGVLNHDFSRTLSVQISVGPTLIEPNSDQVNFVPRFGVRSTQFGEVAVDANNCPLLNDTLGEQDDPTLPNYNPRITHFGFADCGVSSADVLQPGEVQLLGYPRGAPLVPGSKASQAAKLTQFGKPFEFDSTGQLVSVSNVGGTDFTYFAHVALIKDWERWHAQLSYTRANDDSGSFGTNSVQDSFELALRWDPTPLWSVSATGAYYMTDQVSDALVPTLVVVGNEAVPAGVDSVSQIAAVQHVVVQVKNNALSYSAASVSLTGTRKLTEHSSVFASLYYYQQRQEVQVDKQLSFIPGETGASSIVSHWHALTLWLGLDWQFDTYKF